LTLALQFNIYFRDFHAEQEKDCLSFAPKKEKPDGEEAFVNVVVSIVVFVVVVVSRSMWTQQANGKDACIS